MHQRIDPSVYYFGTPIALLTTLNEDGTSNITPVSSAWALGRTYMLCLADDSHGLANMRRLREVVINQPDAPLVGSIEAIADTTGAAEISARNAGAHRTETDKWSVGGFPPLASELVGPDRIAECAIQLEARVERAVPCGDMAYAVHAPVLRVHAREDVVIPGTDHIDLAVWHRCLYTFRHYFAQGEEVGRSFRAEY